MKIRVTDEGQQIIFHRVVDACAYVMTKYHTVAEEPMGRLCIANLMTYTDRVRVERIDHAIRWTSLTKTAEGTRGLQVGDKVHIEVLVGDVRVAGIYETRIVEFEDNTFAVESANDNKRWFYLDTGKSLMGKAVCIELANWDDFGVDQ